MSFAETLDAICRPHVMQREMAQQAEIEAEGAEEEGGGGRGRAARRKRPAARTPAGPRFRSLV